MFIGACVVGVFVLVGCVSTNSSIKDVYLAELSVNKTYDIDLRLGYFGGCVSMSETLGSRGDRTTSNNAQSHCVANMRTPDIDDLSEEFLENLNLTNNAKAQLQNALNMTLPIAKHLQSDVFNWEPPVLAFVLFVLGSCILCGAVGGSSRRRGYKIILLVALVLSTFSLALAMLADIGSLQALNAILDGNRSINSSLLSSDVAIQRGNRQQGLQHGFLALIILFYLTMGITFVQRTPEGVFNYGHIG